MNIKIHKDGYKELLLRCECHEPTHMMSMGYFADDIDSLYVHASMGDNIPFLKRIWIAIKYILGIRIRWAYIEFVLNKKDAKEIETFTKEFVKKYEEFVKEYENKK